MRLKIRNLDFAHSRVKRDEEAYGVYDSEEGESWKPPQHARPQSLTDSFGSYEYVSAELPFPLDNAFLSVLRTGRIYSASIIIHSREGEVFQNLSPILEKRLKNEVQTFTPTTANGTGYVLDRDNNVCAAISDIILENEPEGREICIGGKGSIEKRFPERPDLFSREINYLEGLANLYLDACLQAMGEKDQRIKDLTLYLTG